MEGGPDCPRGVSCRARDKITQPLASFHVTPHGNVPDFFTRPARYRALAKVMRRLEVPLSIKLDRLHTTIQIAMGWTNSHLRVPLRRRRRVRRSGPRLSFQHDRRPKGDAGRGARRLRRQVLTLRL